MDNAQIYADDVDQRASEDYDPYDYIYEAEDSLDGQCIDIDSFVWDVDE